MRASRRGSKPAAVNGPRQVRSPRRGPPRSSGSWSTSTWGIRPRKSASTAGIDSFPWSRREVPHQHQHAVLRAERGRSPQGSDGHRTSERPLRRTQRQPERREANLFERSRHTLGSPGRADQQAPHRVGGLDGDVADRSPAASGRVNLPVPAPRSSTAAGRGKRATSTASRGQPGGRVIVVWPPIATSGGHVPRRCTQATQPYGRGAPAPVRGLTIVVHEVPATRVGRADVRRLVAYWTAWNEFDVDRIGEHLLVAVTKDVEWNDPRDCFVGITELEAAVRRLRSSKPDYRFVIASEIDHQHGRLRYRWDMIRHGRTLMEGLDVVTLDARSGLIAHVDGFFGHPTPIDPVDSGIPLALHAAPVATSTA